MLYHISRNGQNYGPYTLEDLQRYVASGNVLLTDLAKSEEMSDWVPLAQVLGTSIPVAPAPVAVYGTAPAYPVAASAYPDPPNLHWALVLLFSFLTCSLFMVVWNLILATWMKRVQPNSKAIFFYVGALVLAILQFIFRPHDRIHIGQGFHVWLWEYYRAHIVRRIIVPIVIWIVRLTARFTMRSELEEHFNTAEPIGLSLSGVMTFFFGGLYFQYHITLINEMKRAVRYGGAAM